MMRQLYRAIGVIGTLIFIAVFIRTPSFPTPDKILVFLTLVAMIFSQAQKILKRFLPFVIVLLVYESFRGLAPVLNTHVNYIPMIFIDKIIGLGTLPTIFFQNFMWNGSLMWYDFVFYGAYTLHFVLPFALAVLIWKTRERIYWIYIMSFIILSFAGFFTYLIFPAAPPWMASDLGYTEHITRISSYVWAAFGIHDFPSVYNKISPNPVAAVPSLHAAYAFLFAYFITKMYRSKYRYISWIYPVLIWFGTVYMGEHYVVDAILGVIYAYYSVKLSPKAVKKVSKLYQYIKSKINKYDFVIFK